MKTRELIRLLQEEDPSGEEEVCVGNEDIHFLSKQPAYYDGCLQVLKRDPKYEGSYNIIGAEYRQNGSKIQVHTLSIQDVLWEDPEAEITYDSDYTRENYADRVEQIRQEVRDFDKELEEARKK